MAEAGGSTWDEQTKINGLHNAVSQETRIATVGYQMPEILSELAEGYRRVWKDRLSITSPQIIYTGKTNQRQGHHDPINIDIPRSFQASEQRNMQF